MFLFKILLNLTKGFCKILWKTKPKFWRSICIKSQKTLTLYQEIVKQNMKNIARYSILGVLCFLTRVSAQELKVTINTKPKAEIVQTGDKFLVAYTVKNIGKLPVKDIWVKIDPKKSFVYEISTDSLFGLLSYAKYPIASLKSGESVKVFVRVNPLQQDSMFLKLTASTAKTHAVDSSFGFEIVNPVPEISVFNVQAEAQKNVVRWSLINPTQVERYELVRTDVEGNISVLFTEKNMHSSNENMPSFEYVDLNPTFGKSFYHVRLTLKSGEIVFSESIEIIRHKDLAVTVFGKSLNEVIRLSWLKKGWENSVVTLLDKDGETVISKKLNSKNYITVNTQEMKSGTYKVTVKNNEKKYPTPINIKL